MDDVTVPHGKQ